MNTRKIALAVLIVAIPPVIIVAALFFPKSESAVIDTEPAAIFTYTTQIENTFSARLTDHRTGEILKSIDTEIDLPLMYGSAADVNLFVQYSAAADRIIFYISNSSPYDGSSIDPKLNFCDAWYSMNFDGTDLRSIHTRETCGREHWIVHPTKPLIYITENVYSSATEYSVELYEINLTNKSEPRFIATIEKGKELKITHDGKTLYRLGVIYTPSHMIESYLLTTVDLETGEVHTTPIDNPIDHANTNSVSPDLQTLAYHFGFIDIPSGKSRPFSLPDSINNINIWWSGNSRQVAYSLETQNPKPTDDDYYKKLVVYDRERNDTTIEPLHPITDYHMLLWEPSDRYMVFGNPSGMYVYDTNTKESKMLQEGIGIYGSAEAMWVYLPSSN